MAARLLLAARMRGMGVALSAIPPCRARRGFPDGVGARTLLRVHHCLDRSITVLCDPGLRLEHHCDLRADPVDCARSAGSRRQRGPCGAMVSPASTISRNVGDLSRLMPLSVGRPSRSRRGSVASLSASSDMPFSTSFAPKRLRRFPWRRRAVVRAGVIVRSKGAAACSLGVTCDANALPLEGSRSCEDQVDRAGADEDLHARRVSAMILDAAISVIAGRVPWAGHMISLP